jgi:putative hemolysin
MQGNSSTAEISKSGEQTAEVLHHCRNRNRLERIGMIQHPFDRL